MELKQRRGKAKSIRAKAILSMAMSIQDNVKFSYVKLRGNLAKAMLTVGKSKKNQDRADAKSS